jgi:hypothetical protein
MKLGEGSMKQALGGNFFSFSKKPPSSSGVAITDKCSSFGNVLAIKIQTHEGQKFLGLYSLSSLLSPNDCHHDSVAVTMVLGKLSQERRPFFKASCIPKEGTVNYFWRKQPRKSVGGVEKYFKGLGKKQGQGLQERCDEREEPGLHNILIHNSEVGKKTKNKRGGSGEK